ncbi:MAG: TIGR00341 family protein [Parvibaculum sp.]
MAKRQLEITAPAGYAATLAAIATQQEAEDVYSELGEEDRCLVRIVCDTAKVQAIVDGTHKAVEKGAHWRLTILPVEAVVVPEMQKVEPGDDAVPRFSFRGRTAPREEILNEVEKGAELNADYLVLIALSGVVAAVGLLNDSVVALIGAMVIAPLLGPNLAFAFGVALGNVDLMRRAMVTNIVGLFFAVLFATLLGLLLGEPMSSAALSARTIAGYDSIAIGLAAGAAAVLSLTTGVSSALVGVMVAVAILPPAVTAGLMLGGGDLKAAGGAAFLLAVNIVCINLAAQIVFVVKRILPRTWAEKKGARRSLWTNFVTWVVLLSGLAGAIYMAGW